MYSAERESLIEVPLASNDSPDVSWAPDSSVILVADRQLHLLQSDGAPIKVFDEPSMSAQVEWSPDSKWALGMLAEGSSSRVVKVDINLSTVTTLLEYGNGIVQNGWDNLALSPDGAWIALSWLNEADRTMRLAVLPSGEPFPAVLADHSVVSFQLPPGPSLYDWLHTVVWSPDGTQLVFALGPTDPVTPGLIGASSLQLLDVQSGTVRELARPAQGFYSSGPLWWSTDGSTVFKTWSGCIACDGGGSGIDVIEVASGEVVRTIPQAGWLGTLDGVRHLISTADGLLTVRGLEEPRMLLPGHLPECLLRRQAVAGCEPPGRHRITGTRADGLRRRCRRLRAGPAGQRRVGRADRGDAKRSDRADAEHRTALELDVAPRWFDGAASQSGHPQSRSGPDVGSGRCVFLEWRATWRTGLVPPSWDSGCTWATSVQARRERSRSLPTSIRGRASRYRLEAIGSLTSKIATSSRSMW